MRSVQSYKHYIYARCCPGQVGRWNLIVACGMLKPVYFAFVKTMLKFWQMTHFVKSRAHLPRPTRKIIAMIALRHAILMRADPVVSVHVHCLFSGPECSCKMALFEWRLCNLVVPLQPGQWYQLSHFSSSPWISICLQHQRRTRWTRVALCRVNWLSLWSFCSKHLQ